MLKDFAEQLKIQKLIFLVNTDTDEKIIGVTISLGISEYKTGDNEKTLLQKADKALYKAKESGRNRAEVYEEVSTNLS